MRLRIDIFISAIALVAIMWGVWFAIAQEHRRTPEYLQSVYRELNEKFFENTLPTVRLEWADLTDAEAVGQTFLESDDSFVIKVDRNTNFSFWMDDELRDTVEHEACHVATWGADEDDHGPIFKGCMARIKAHSK